LKNFCFYLAVLLGLGLVGTFVVELWLRTLGHGYAEHITDRTRFCFAASSVLVPALFGMSAGWREWNGPYYIVACAATGAIYGNHIGTTVAATLLGGASFVVIREVHRMITMKNPQQHGPDAYHAPDIIMGDIAQLARELDSTSEQDTPDVQGEDGYLLCDSIHVLDAKGLVNRLEREGVDFYVEAPHYDPNQGGAEGRGSFGQNALVHLYVQTDHIERFEELREQHYAAQSEDKGTSLLQAFRSFGVNHDLDYTVENDEKPKRLEE